MVLLAAPAAIGRKLNPARLVILTLAFVAVALLVCKAWRAPGATWVNYKKIQKGNFGYDICKEWKINKCNSNSRSNWNTRNYKLN